MLMRLLPATLSVCVLSSIGFHLNAQTTIYIDSVNGSDTTGDGSLGSPYETLKKGKTEATSGDLIRVKAGTYEDNDLLKNGVNWYFEDNAIIDISGSSREDAIFDDEYIPGGVVCHIAGNGTFIANVLDEDSGTGGGVLEIRNPASQVVIEAVEMRNTGGSPTIYQTGGQLVVYAGKVDSDAYDAIWLDAGSTNDGDLDFFGYIDVIESFDDGIEMVGLDNATVFVDSESIVSGGSAVESKLAIGTTDVEVLASVAMISPNNARAVELFSNASQTLLVKAPDIVGGVLIQNDGGTNTFDFINLSRTVPISPPGSATVATTALANSGTSTFLNSHTPALAEIEWAGASSEPAIAWMGGGLELNRVELIAGSTAPHSIVRTGAGPDKVGVKIIGLSTANKAPNLAAVNLDQTEGLLIY